MQHQQENPRRHRWRRVKDKDYDKCQICGRLRIKDTSGYYTRFLYARDDPSASFEMGYIECVNWKAEDKIDNDPLELFYNWP